MKSSFLKNLEPCRPKNFIPGWSRKTEPQKEQTDFTYSVKWPEGGVNGGEKELDRMERMGF